MSKKELSGIFLTATLGMLTAFGPFVTDFYLPVMPEMTVFFHTSPSSVGLSLTMGMIGLALGQILIGPLSDKYGRRRLLLPSMTLFCLASLLILFSPNIYVFNALRVFQGLGGAGAIVISKSIAADMFSGVKLTNFLALLGAINGVAPVAAPIVGGAMTNFTTWRGVFCLLLAIGVILTVCCARLGETLPPERRVRKNLAADYANLFKVFLSKRFTLSTLAMMFAFFTFFAYIAASPFIMQTVYGLSPFEFSLCFGFNAFMIGVGAATATKFRHQNTALKYSSIYLAASTALVALCQLTAMPLAVLMPCYVLMLTGFGLMQPVATAIALDSQRRRVGAASAIFGAGNFVAGAAASPLVALGDVLWSSSAVMLIGAAGCLCLTLPLAATVKREAMSVAASGNLQQEITDNR